MKKHIVLSVNSNPDYLYYTPLVCWAWRQFGWEPIIFYEGQFLDTTILSQAYSVATFHRLKPAPGYRSDTITQVSRLYAGCVADGYLMTGDIDMIPLSDYWHPPANENAITIWGHDLTGYTHYPICYIGMSAEQWRAVMGLVDNNFNGLIFRDLERMPDAKNPDFYKYWFTDQELITQRINETQFEKIFIHRTQYPNGFATGRVDRGAWSLDHKQLIDCHALRDMYKGSDTGAMNLAKTMRLLYRVWPQEDFTWFRDYTLEFRKLANNG